MTEDSMSQATLHEVISFQEQFKAKKSYTTAAILVLLICMFLLEQFWGGSTDVPTLVRMGANTRELVLEGEVWRLLTSIFLHSGYVHVFSNCYALMALGVFFDKILGSAKFISLFLLSGFFGSLASAFIGQPLLSVGASGALWGLFGASAALTLRPNSFLPDIIRIRMRRVTLINLLINLGVSFLPAIDFWAHIGGGVCGFLIGILYVRHVASKNMKSFRFQQMLQQLLAAVLLLLLVVSFGLAFSLGKPWSLK